MPYHMIGFNHSVLCANCRHTDRNKMSVFVPKGRLRDGLEGKVSCLLVVGRILSAVTRIRESYLSAGDYLLFAI